MPDTANLPAGDVLQNAGARKSSRRAYLTEHLAALASYGNAGDERAAAARDELAALDEADQADKADKRRARRAAPTP